MLSPTLLISTAALYWSLRHLLQCFLQIPAVRLRLSEADVADVSTKVLSGLHASLASGAGLYIMWETMDDCIFSRSAAIAPFTYVGVSYMSCDVLAMYLTYCKTRRLSFTNTQSVSLFLKSRPLLVFHHLFLIFGYPLLVYDGLRKGMGDFLIGTLFLRELSSPLLSAAKIMRKIKMEGSVLYQVNGVALVLLFFLVRIASTPLTLLFYSSQHHDWSLVQALSAMRPICHLMLSAELTLQLYWFSQILSTASRRKTKPS
ncbi:TLC domain-containing protein 3A [Geodia barretti]|uniref:TLC domain-containing protein 3A n=1 Tax=Geodia barretti TaxID=519541 RepID=A0AA35QXW3_GEOBA|nr:TLC domain-containing protein 3A [Geodia barretti]